MCSGSWVNPLHSIFEPLPQCEENEYFSTTFTPHLSVPGFFPGTGGFFHGHPNSTRRILFFGTDFGQLSYQQTLATTGEPKNTPTIFNLAKILGEAEVPLDDCFLTNAVLCAWREDSCLDNHAVWRRYSTYIVDCAAWHRRFIAEHRPEFIVLMGTPALNTFGRVLFPELATHWRGLSSLKDVYRADLETFQVPNGPGILLMTHPSFWDVNAKKFPDVAKKAIGHLRSMAAAHAPNPPALPKVEDQGAY
jgi:uracil-DNA glycosylase